MSVECPCWYLLVITGSDDSFNGFSIFNFQFAGSSIILFFQVRIRKLAHSHCKIFPNKKLWGTEQQQAVRSGDKGSVLHLATGHCCDCG